MAVRMAITIDRLASHWKAFGQAWSSEWLVTPGDIFKHFERVSYFDRALLQRPR